MKINYLVPKMNYKFISERQLFIYPDGINTACLVKQSNNKCLLMLEKFDMDLYTANGFIQCLPKKKLPSDEMYFENVVRYFVEQNIDYYPYWVIGIDRLVRYKKFNVDEAIAYQLNLDRQKLYDEIFMIEAELYPGIYGRS